MFLLVEHLSRPDRDMPLRASEYKNCCHRHQIKKGEPPGPVLCVTLYHGKEPWKTPSNLSQWMKLGPGQEAQVASSMAACEYLLLDISKLDVEALAMRAHAKMAVSLLRSIVFGREDEWLRSHIALIDEWLGQPDRQSRIRTLIRYCLQASSLDFSAFQREIDALPYPRVKDAFMSTADMLMEKGLETGLKRGLEQGRSQGEIIGKISAYERFLKVDPTNPEKLSALSLDDLRERMRQLEAKLFQ